ncbi:hypothetical protein CYMTET_41925 [Cymbomonas tetramitiformis]|uniref:Uncharacterized protein n=1 Tax=Cymbomonas tetramitiformis TaxID=36881 RepID=A0AAE0C538_9CHLO|nr:hypothetical protein CYMTET_41925 [Cymbomonas tetramitiformis]
MMMAKLAARRKSQSGAKGLRAEGAPSPAPVEAPARQRAASPRLRPAGSAMLEEPMPPEMEVTVEPMPPEMEVQTPPASHPALGTPREGLELEDPFLELLSWVEGRWEELVHLVEQGGQGMNAGSELNRRQLAGLVRRLAPGVSEAGLAYVEAQLQVDTPMPENRAEAASSAEQGLTLLEWARVVRETHAAAVAVRAPAHAAVAEGLSRVLGALPCVAGTDARGRVHVAELLWQLRTKMANPVARARELRFLLAQLFRRGAFSGSDGAGGAACLELGDVERVLQDYADRPGAQQPRSLTPSKVALLQEASLAGLRWKESQAAREGAAMRIQGWYRAAREERLLLQRRRQLKAEEEAEAVRHREWLARQEGEWDARRQEEESAWQVRREQEEAHRVQRREEEESALRARWEAQEEQWRAKLAEEEVQRRLVWEREEQLHQERLSSKREEELSRLRFEEAAMRQRVREEMKETEARMEVARTEAREAEAARERGRLEALRSAKEPAAVVLIQAHVRRRLAQKELRSRRLQRRVDTALGRTGALQPGEDGSATATQGTTLEDALMGGPCPPWRNPLEAERAAASAAAVSSLLRWEGEGLQEDPPRGQPWEMEALLPIPGEARGGAPRDFLHVVNITPEDLDLAAANRGCSVVGEAEVLDEPAFTSPSREAGATADSGSSGRVLELLPSPDVLGRSEQLLESLAAAHSQSIKLPQEREAKLAEREREASKKVAAVARRHAVRQAHSRGRQVQSLLQDIGTALEDVEGMADHLEDDMANTRHVLNALQEESRQQKNLYLATILKQVHDVETEIDAQCEETY